MEFHEALEVVCRLANALHPETGAPLESTSVLRHPQALRALNRAIATLEFQ